MRLLLPLVYMAALTMGCGRQTEATPLERPEVASARVPTPAANVQPVKPALDVAEPRVPAAEAVQKPDTVPAAFAQDKKTGPVGEGLKQPQDKGGKLIEDLLRPKDAALPFWVKKPRSLPATPFLEKPALPTTPFHGQPPRLAVKTGKPIRPHALPEGMPLFGKRTSPRLPADIQLPAGALVQWPSPNSDELPSLPTLAQRQLDRASLADPTAESSTAAALDGSIPLRTSPAPFVRLNLPNPFEHRETVRLRTPPPEDTTPAN
jgi:hypothetical protein